VGQTPYGLGYRYTKVNSARDPNCESAVISSALPGRHVLRRQHAGDLVPTAPCPLALSVCELGKPSQPPAPPLPRRLSQTTPARMAKTVCIVGAEAAVSTSRTTLTCCRRRSLRSRGRQVAPTRRAAGYVQGDPFRGTVASRWAMAAAQGRRRRAAPPAHARQPEQAHDAVQRPRVGGRCP